MEEDEEAAEAAAEAEANGEEVTPNAESGTAAPDGGNFVDREVGEWVLQALDRRRRGVMGSHAKPALHAAPLDAGVGKGAGVKAVAVDA